MAKKKKGSKGIVLLLIVILIAVGGYLFYNNGLKAVDLNDSNAVQVDIPESSSSAKIAGILEENNLIRNKMIFRYRIKSRKVGSKLKAGTYSMSKSMNVDQLIDQLMDGGENNKNATKFTIPEGYELKQMAKKLSDENLVDEARFLDLVSKKENFEADYEFLKEIPAGQSLEGFLFPSTYEVFVNASEEDIIKKMLDEFGRVYKNEIKDNLESTGLDLNELVTLASIVEREGKLDEERPIMAGVFYNRIDQGMMLQSCATVQYILGERKEVLSTADTRTESPYNTYLHNGLPPAPIAAPGLVSIRATLNPADVDYLFFVKTGEDGSHTFSKTFADHKKAKPKN